jgi:hypothetical protein
MGSCELNCCLSAQTHYTMLILAALEIPIHLAEMSPPAFRATFPGVAYQLGNVGGFTALELQSHTDYFYR